MRWVWGRGELSTHNLIVTKTWKNDNKKIELINTRRLPLTAMRYMCGVGFHYAKATRLYSLFDFQINPSNMSTRILFVCAAWHLDVCSDNSGAIKNSFDSDALTKGYTVFVECVATALNVFSVTNAFSISFLWHSNQPRLLRDILFSLHISAHLFSPFPYITLHKQQHFLIRQKRHIFFAPSPPMGELSDCKSRSRSISRELIFFCSNCITSSSSEKVTRKNPMKIFTLQCRIYGLTYDCMRWCAKLNPS